MPVRKLSTGQWQADIYTVDRSGGRSGKRVRKKFATKGEALAYESFVLSEIQTSPWLADAKENRSLNS